MGLDVSPIGRPGFDVTPTRAARAARTPEGAGRTDAAEISSEIPASPPPEVLDAIDAAGAVARELHEQGRELRFVGGGAGERVRIEVRDLDGNVLRTIPPSELLDVATGSPLD